MSVPLKQAELQRRPVALEVRRHGSRGCVPVSVIIPLSAGEPEPLRLLSILPETFEVILARGGTRATSMNQAAAIAKGQHLWFVHADTVLGTRAIAALETRLSQNDAMFYFDLRFDGGALMWLTEMGVFIRSRLLQLPFGDQALCLSRNNFWALGGYDEHALRGEDHLLVRKAHRTGLAVQSVSVSILTSARKYRREGWFRTTWQHLRLTFRQMAQ